MRVTNETVYVCDKCGATFFHESLCKRHEEECDGVARGRRLSDELTNALNRLKLEEHMRIETELGESVCEAVYDDERKCIVLTSL